MILSFSVVVTCIRDFFTLNSILNIAYHARLTTTGGAHHFDRLDALRAQCQLYERAQIFELFRICK